jgi:hypothetical protein
MEGMVLERKGPRICGMEQKLQVMLQPSEILMKLELAVVNSGRWFLSE